MFCAIQPKAEVNSDDERVEPEASRPSPSPEVKEEDSGSGTEVKAEERERSPTPHLAIELQGARPEVTDDEGIATSVFPDASPEDVGPATEATEGEIFPDASPDVGPATEAAEDVITGVAGVCLDSVLHMFI